MQAGVWMMTEPCGTQTMETRMAASSERLIATKGHSPSERQEGRSAATVAAPLLLAACGGSSNSSLPDALTAAQPSKLNQSQASRFLSQAAVGHAKADIENLQASSIDAWLNTQFALPRGQSFWDFLVAGGYQSATNINATSGFDPMIWSQLMGGQDILRQRVGLAFLSQWVVGFDGFSSSWRQFVMAAYLDILWNHAFGNFRDLLEGIATSPAMGYFLTFLGNRKADPRTGSIPDENFARELMQLFTIGLYQLNMDGTLAQANGAPVPTYTQDDVSQAARIWTGYTLNGTDNTTPERMRMPMIVDPRYSETGAVTFLGLSIAAGTDAVSRRKMALDHLFNHPNVPPFVSKQLIQRLVTSNPSPAYVERVARVFADNGGGTRGDLKAVIRAILTDTEARSDTALSNPNFGKLREPVLRLVQWARAFGVKSASGNWAFGNTSSSSNRLAQSPGRSPSVFNWFRPGYVPPGTDIATNGLVAPEFQVTNEPSFVAYINYMQSVIANGAGDAKPDYTYLTWIANESVKLVEELNLVLAANQLSDATVRQIATALDSISVTTSAGQLNRIHAALVLVMASPEYLIQR